jgi:hypothetical protein
VEDKTKFKVFFSKIQNDKFASKIVQLSQIIFNQFLFEINCIFVNIPNFFCVKKWGILPTCGQYYKNILINI